MNRTGDIYPNGAKMLLMNADDEIYSRERVFVGPVGWGQSLCKRAFLCMHPEGNGKKRNSRKSSLYHTHTEQCFNHNRRDSD